VPRNILEVLIVEDSPPQAAYLQAILERNHFAVRRAERGTQALEALAERLPDLVVTDIVMPGMDGYELCRRIKSDDRFKQVPVILLTALADLKDVIKGLECAADSFVVKPYDEKDLLSRIEYVLANAAVRAKNDEGQPEKGTWAP
jgi:DNA-binding response OmpR family regulator